MREIRRLLPLVLILASACSGGSPDQSDESAPTSAALNVKDALRADGPLLGVAFTGHVDREDPKVRPSLAFTTQDTEVTAVFGLGDVDEGSTLVVTWYRVGGLEEREALFTHEIAVASGGLAFSQAVAPKGLAPGIYDTEATMDGHLVHSPLVVREAGGSEASATAQAASEDGSGDVPQSGDGWSSDGTEFPMPPGISEDTCTVSIHPGLIPGGYLDADAWWMGPCTTGTLTATVSGPPTTLASSDSLQAGVTGIHGTAYLCLLSGGSDLPGTVVHLEATGSATGSKDFTLPDYGESLTAGLEGSPGAGTRVGSGDRIDILAIAMVAEPALGVKRLTVDVGGEPLESVGNASGSDQPVACDPNRLIAALETTYEIPSDPPPVIELCATGVGFDGTESKNCISYYTGEVWKGTANVASSAVYPDGSTCRDGWQLEFSFGVGSDGTIEGQGTAELTSGPTCPFPINVEPFSHVEYLVLGEKTAAGFSIRFEPGDVQPSGGEAFLGGFPPTVWCCGVPVAVAVSGNSGTGEGMWQFESGNPPATYSANGTFTIECITCEEAGG